MGTISSGRKVAEKPADGRPAPKTSGGPQTSSWARWAMVAGAVIHAAVFAVIWTGVSGVVLPDWLRVMLYVILAGEIVGFSLGAFDCRSYWLSLFLIIAIKVPGAMAALIAIPTGFLDWKVLLLAAVFDLFWSAVLVRVLGALLRAPSDPQPVMQLAEAIVWAKDQRGESLADLSMANPVMVVFLRHFGCTFCREALADLQRLRPEIEKLGTQLTIIHMSTDDEAEFMLGGYGLADVHRISDPFRRVYKAFELRRGSASQLLGLWVWWRGFRAGVLGGHGVGAVSGDALQLPGVFMIWKGRLVREYRHKSSADRPNYREIAACDACPS